MGKEVDNNRVRLLAWYLIDSSREANYTADEFQKAIAFLYGWTCCDATEAFKKAMLILAEMGMHWSGRYDKKIKTIFFVDEGQDFLEWDINDEGKVVACRPFQADIWVGMVVHNKDIKPGDLLDFIRPGSDRFQQLIHPVEKVQ